jgi:hypothetical protein
MASFAVSNYISNFQATKLGKKPKAAGSHPGIPIAAPKKVEEEGGGSHVEQQAVVSSHNWGPLKPHTVNANEAQDAHHFPDQHGKDSRFFVGQKVDLVDPAKNSRLPPESMGFDPNKRVKPSHLQDLKNMQGKDTKLVMFVYNRS